ncbi:MAG: glycosyltransferase family 87 protein [Anaerolineales bacterium]
MESKKKQPRSSASFRNIFVIAGVAFLLLIYPVLWLRIVNDPAQRTAVDFLPFYAAGRIAITQGMSRVYDWEAQRQAENDVLDETIRQILVSAGKPVTPQSFGAPMQSSEVNPFPHPPFILPALMLLAHLDYLPAFIVWSVLMTALFILSAFILVKLVPQAQRWDRWVLLFGTALFFPAFFSIVNGQDTALLLLGASIWLSGLLRERERLSGLGLALTLIRPHMGVMLAPPFLFKRRRVWAWFCAGASLLVLVSVLLVGRSGVVDFLRILVASENGGFKFYNEELMVNLIGFLRRTFPSMPVASVHLVGWVGFAVAIIYLCLVWAKSAEIKERQIGLAVIVMIIGTPHIHYHDLALLLIPLFGIIRILLDKKLMQPGEVVLLPLVISLLLFTSFLLLPGLKYLVYYALLLWMVVALRYPEKVVFWKRIKKQEVRI